jgi:signal transduction histidine kinase
MATPQEAVAMVRDAAKLLAEQGEPGLSQFRGKSSAFVWKDSYVFVSNCSTGMLLAHPFQPEREGTPIADGPSYGGVTAAERAKAQCEAAQKPGGGWFAYPFPKPGQKEPARKVSFLMRVEGQPYIVGAGIYDQDDSIEALERISAAP